MEVKMTIEQIAKTCHEANRALCLAFGDTSQQPWEDAAVWQRESAVKGVEYLRDNPNAPPSAQHDAWTADKVADGWVYGVDKNAAAKTHPCLVPYDELPLDQKAKDYVFQAVARALLF